LRLSLHEAIQAAIDNNANVRLLKERIVAAQSAASTSLGALLAERIWVHEREQSNRQSRGLRTSSR
jgi:hypothetical protein